ncbi:hypothetical protein BHE74_00047420, partial [Ensete ventricosum]
MKTPTYWYSVERNEVATVPMHRESLYQITIHRRSAFSTVSRFFFSLFFFLPPSADTARNRLPTIEIDYYGRFWMITGRKQSQSVVPPGSRRSCTGQLALANAGFSTISFLLGTTTPLVSGFLFFSPHAWEEGTRRHAQFLTFRDCALDLGALHDNVVVIKPFLLLLNRWSDTPVLLFPGLSGESFTLETSSHCSSAKAIPTTAATGIRISVRRPGSIAQPIGANPHRTAAIKQGFRGFRARLALFAVECRFRLHAAAYK